MKQRKKAEPGFQVFLIISLVMHLIGAGVAFASGRKTRTSILKLSSVNVRLYEPKSFPGYQGRKTKPSSLPGQKKSLKKIIAKSGSGSKSAGKSKPDSKKVISQKSHLEGEEILERALAQIEREVEQTRTSQEETEWNQLVGEISSDLEKWSYYERARQVYAQNWVIPPSVPADENLRVRVIVVIDEQGRVKDFQVLSWSGNQELDLSVQKLLQKVKQLPPPPWEKKEIKLGFEFRPFGGEQ